MRDGTGSSRIPLEVSFESVVEDMTDFVVRWLPDGTRTFVNDAYLECFGLTRDEAIGTSFLPLVHEKDRDLLQLKLASLTPERPVAVHLQRVLRGDDTVGWQHWVDRAFFDDDGRVVELQSVGRDVTDWRIGEESLRASEARFRALCKHAPVGIFLDDADGKSVFVNDRYAEIVGLDPEQALLDGWIRNIHPDDREIVENAWRVVLADPRPVETTYRFRRNDGEVRWVDGRAAPVRDEGGDLLGFVGTLLDVTDEQRAKGELRASQERFRALCELAPVGIFLNDDEGGCVYLNETGCRITGLTPETAAGYGWADRVHPEDRDEVVASWQESVRTASRFERRFRFRHADGTVRWTSTVADRTLNAAGLPSGHVGCVIDVTHRVDAEREMNRRHEFEQLVSRLSTDFVDAPPDRDEELFSRGLAALADYAGTGCAGLYSFGEDRRTARLEYHHEDSECVDAERYRLIRERLGRSISLSEMRMQWCWRETLAGRTVVLRNRDEFPAPAGAADLAWLDGRAAEGQSWNGSILQTPLRVEDRIIGCLFVNDHGRPADWSEGFVEQMQLVARLFAGALHRRAVERRLDEHRALLAHVGRVGVAGELSAGIAHELNQPLYAILNCARAIENTIAVGGDAPDRELLTDAAAEIGRAAERAGEMVRRLRDFVRRVEPSGRPCRVSTLVEESLALVAHDVRRSEVAVDVDLPSTLPEVEVDAVQVEQVFVNLLLNAVESLATSADERRITVNAAVEGASVVISVADTGPGFDRSEGDPLEAFVTTKESGMGIGLAICRTIVEAHGGRLWIEESNGGGLVQFSLPIVPRPADPEDRR